MKIKTLQVNVLLLILLILMVSCSKPSTSKLEVRTVATNTIAIGMRIGGYGYNISEIDVQKDTNYTIVFTNQQNLPHDLVILKAGIYGIDSNVSYLTSSDYDLHLGPITNGTVSGSWKSPNFDTWVIYMASNSNFFIDSGSLIKVGNPTEQRPFGSVNENPGFEYYVLFSTLVVVGMRRIKTKKY